MWSARSARRRPEPDGAAAAVRRLELALDQLERAELYVAAAIGAELPDPRQRRELEDLRAHVAATRRSLARPSVVDLERRGQTSSR